MNTIEVTTILNDASVEGPYALLINSLLWADLAGIKSYPLNKSIENIVKLQLSVPILEDALWFPRGRDFELILGHDLSIDTKTMTISMLIYFLLNLLLSVLDPCLCSFNFR